MSNETMTDALRALDLIYHEVCDTKQTRDAYEFLAARLRGEAAPDSVRSLSAKWRALAESKGYRGITHADIGNVEAACLVVSANELEAAPAAPETMTEGDRTAAQSRMIDELTAPAPVVGDAVAALPAAWRAHADSLDEEGDYKSAKIPRHYAGKLEAALAQDRASQGAAPGVPEGWALVPKEPTLEMCRAVLEEMSFCSPVDNYRKMLAAAPKPTPVGVEGFDAIRKALADLVRAGKRFRNTVVETRGVRAMDEHDLALSAAEAALAQQPAAVDGSRLREIAEGILEARTNA